MRPPVAAVACKKHLLSDIKMLTREDVAPAGEEFIFVLDLIMLRAALLIGTVRHPLVVYGNRRRLVDRSKARLTDPKREISVLVTGRGKPRIEAAKLAPKIGAYCNRCSRTIVDILDIIEHRQLRIAVTTVIPCGAILPSDSAGFLHAAVCEQ